MVSLLFVVGVGGGFGCCGWWVCWLLGVCGCLGGSRLCYGWCWGDRVGGLNALEERKNWQRKKEEAHHAWMFTVLLAHAFYAGNRSPKDKGASSRIFHPLKPKVLLAPPTRFTRLGFGRAVANISSRQPRRFFFHRYDVLYAAPPAYTTGVTTSLSCYLVAGVVNPRSRVFNAPPRATGVQPCFTLLRPAL